MLLFRAVFDLAGSARGTRQVDARYTSGRSLAGNDRGAAVNLRAVFPISVVRGPRPLRGSRRPARRSPAGRRPGRDRATAGRGPVNPEGPAWCYRAGGPVRSGRRGTRAGAPRPEGGSVLMRWWRRVLLARSRAAGRAWPSRRLRPDLTAEAEPSVDAAGPGRQASATCLPARHPATAEARGRSTPTATAPDPAGRQAARVRRPAAPGRVPPAGEPGGVWPGRPAGRLGGRRAGSLDLPGHLPTLAGPDAQVSGEIYLRG